MDVTVIPTAWATSPDARRHFEIDVESQQWTMPDPLHPNATIWEGDSPPATVTMGELPPGVTCNNLRHEGSQGLHDHWSFDIVVSPKVPPGSYDIPLHISEPFIEKDREGIENTRIHTDIALPLTVRQFPRLTHPQAPPVR